MNKFVEIKYEKNKNQYHFYYQTDFTFFEFGESYVICLINMELI